MARHTPAFAPITPAQARLTPLPSSQQQNAARTVVEEGRKRARSLIYGADGAFRGLADRRQQLERLVRQTGTQFSGIGGNWGGNHNNNNNHHGFNWHGRGEDDDDDGHDEGFVDPSWGVAPGVHVVLRGRADMAYQAAVANLMTMSVALKSNATFVDPSVPIVIILSWMGARQSHLAKYKRFYEDLGYEVHTVMNDLRTAIFPPASSAQARKIAQLIADQPSDRPVFVHAFSIGTGIYGLLLDSIRHEKEKFDMFRERVTGVVFDSGPAPIFPKDVAKGLHTVCPMVSKAIWEPIASAFFFLTKARKCYGRSEDALRKRQFPAPQLYFYSGDDKVIANLQGSVEEFIEKNKQRGLEVYNKFWEKSVHASHLKMHPDEYLANLSTFLNRCMEVRKQKGALPAPTGVQ